MTANMMAGLLLSGITDSGFGVKVAWFYCPSRDVPRYFKDAIMDKLIDPDGFDMVEQDGYVMCAAWKSDAGTAASSLRLDSLRREPHRFAIDLPHFIARSKARNIQALKITGSGGSFCVSLLYRPTLGIDPGV